MAQHCTFSGHSGTFSISSILLKLILSMTKGLVYKFNMTGLEQCNINLIFAGSNRDVPYWKLKYSSSFGIVGLQKAILELPPEHPTRIRLLFLLKIRLNGFLLIIILLKDSMQHAVVSLIKFQFLRFSCTIYSKCVSSTY